jgi:hypothetical protein
MKVRWWRARSCSACSRLDFLGGLREVVAVEQRLWDVVRACALSSDIGRRLHRCRASTDGHGDRREIGCPVPAVPLMYGVVWVVWVPLRGADSVTVGGALSIVNVSW